MQWTSRRSYPSSVGSFLALIFFIFNLRTHDGRCVPTAAAVHPWPPRTTRGCRHLSTPTHFWLPWVRRRGNCLQIRGCANWRSGSGSRGRPPTTRGMSSASLIVQNGIGLVATPYLFPNPGKWLESEQKLKMLGRNYLIFLSQFLEQLCTEVDFHCISYDNPWILVM